MECGTELAELDIQILQTNEDKTGDDLSKMSDFSGNYIRELTCKIKDPKDTASMVDVPFADLGILNDVIQHTKVLVSGEIGLLPDFDSIPRDIKEKLKKGIYTIGESKQVDGNLRSVILDENKVRIKDITLKKVVNDPGALETFRSITSQMQLRQISLKLNEVIDLQSYQIKRARARDMKAPFMNARDYIYLAQLSHDPATQRFNLEKASDELMREANVIRSDINVNGEELAQLTSRPFFQRTGQMNMIMEFIAEDIQYATKAAGLHMQVCEYLGKKEEALVALQKYDNLLKTFSRIGMGRKKKPALQMMQEHFPYNESNRDCWFTLEQDILQLKEPEISELYIMSVEDCNNG